MTETDAQRLDRLWSAEPTPIPVERGPWRFELRGDEIADLSFDGSPVARSVRAVARDRDWNTVPTTVTAVESINGGTRLRLDLRGFGADISATVDVVADAQSLTVALVATSHSEFLTNRLGLVVLHPPTLAGEHLTVGTETGEVHTTFPLAVSPHQPAVDIRSLTWTHDGVTTHAEFSGDTFEMEDQRNWTDASYKTYSRPLSLPFPYPIEPGETVEQSVSFTATRVQPRAHADRTDAVELVRTGRPVPEVTVGASTIPDASMPGSPADLPPGVAALLVELDTRTPSWRHALARATSEAGDLPLDVRIVADGPDGVRQAVEQLVESGTRVLRLGVFSTTSHVTEAELWDALTSAARDLPDVTLVGGARSHFTELNREHQRLPDGIPELSFSLTPQMHATERAQIIESIPMQAVVVASAGAIAHGRPLHVGPITLRPRFNAVATSGATGQVPSDLGQGYGAELTEGATDERQRCEGLEAWTIASFAAIASAFDAARVASVSYFEASGPRGLGDQHGSYPVERAISALASLAGGELLVPARPPVPGLWCVGSRQADGSWQVVLTNIGTATIATEVRIEGSHHLISLDPYTVLRLSNVTDAVSHKFTDPRSTTERNGTP